MKKDLSRRDFLRYYAAGSLGAAFLLQYSCGSGKSSPSASGAKSNDPKSFGIGLQLYTIRDAMGTDPRGSLKKVSDSGYRYVEPAGYADGKFYGIDPEEFRKIVNDLGMEVISSHTQVEAQGITLDNAKKMAEDHARLGVKYCVQPWVVEEARTTVSSFRKMVSDWNMVGEIMKDHGIKFGYHDHNFEFAPLEGIIPYYDIFMKELDKDLVTMELDLFWVTKAGQDPVEIIKKYPGRFEIFHMKDMYTKQDPFFTTVGVNDFAPVGAGLIDFKRILAEKETAGMKYMIVEQDQPTKGSDPFTDIKVSIDNLTTKILA
jgi:sugar phosphate isomerase/epimerase